MLSQIPYNEVKFNRHPVLVGTSNNELPRGNSLFFIA